MTTVLTGLPPAQFQAWQLLLQLGRTRMSWVLIGGQMMHLLAAEHGVLLPRVTLDADVLVDIRASPGATEKLSGWLERNGLLLNGVSPEGVGHRFSRPASPGPGSVLFDVLAPEGVGARANVFTKRPARTVQVPGSSVLLARAELVEVTVHDVASGVRETGRVRRPDLLGAIVGKAAATTIAVRANPERDWQDAALLLSLIADPLTARRELARSHRLIGRLAELRDVEHPAWQVLEMDQRRNGSAALRLILDAGD